MIRNNLQICYAWADMPGVKAGNYYVAEKRGLIRWEAAATKAEAIKNYWSDKRQRPVKTCHDDNKKAVPGG